MTKDRIARIASSVVFGLLAMVVTGLLAMAPAASAQTDRATPAGTDIVAESGVGAAAAAVREDSLRFPSGGVELHGMLRLPPDPAEGPFPAVLILPGGGSRYLTLEPDYWAERFARAGIAAFVYHKRGTGDSGGEWASATFEDLIADAGAALAALRRHPEIAGRGRTVGARGIDRTDSDRGSGGTDGGPTGGAARIGVMGFSQGGRLAPIVAARFGADAAVAVSGPQLPPAETRLYSLGNALRRGGMPDENLEIALALWREHMDRLASGADLAPLDVRIAEAAERMNPRALPPMSGDYTPSPIFNSLDFDGVPDLARLDIPFLAMYGRDDRTVPTTASVEVLRETFAASGYGGLALIVIPGVGHGLSVDPETRHPIYESVPVPWLAVKLGADG